MKILLSAGSLYTLPLPKIFELARDTGFDGVEVIISPDYPRDGKEVYSFEEELIIGVEEGDEYYQLYRPQDIKITDAGDIYVID